MEDSGKRQEFNTGAVRDTAEGKSRPDLISPYAQMRKGLWLAEGARKYKERNWESGMPISRCIASIERHLQQYKMGLVNEDHLAAIAVNVEFIMHYEAMIEKGLLPRELDDMPKYEQQTTFAASPSVLFGVAKSADTTSIGEMCVVKALRKSSYTKEEQDEIIKNILTIPKEEWWENGSDKEQLCNLFSWSETQQGTDYWYIIHKKLCKEKCYD